MADEIIKASRAKSAGFLAISAVFVAIGIWMCIREPGDWRAIGCLAFFGLGILVFGAQIIAPATRTLTRESFTYKGLLGRGFTIPWAQVESFHLWKNPYASQKLVAWTYLPGFKKTSVLGAVSSSLGADSAIPGLWTVKVEEVLARMDQRLAASRP
jgi:hypothetical protein